jgi:hypothetical protein
MSRVFKYEVPVADSFHIDMPANAQVLTVQIQKEKVCIWALVEDGNPLTRRAFRMAGTGHLIDKAWQLCYFQLLSGDLVFHVFEVKD